jgi:polyferredoxin
LVSRDAEKRFRVNLLNGYPKLRRFLRSDWWPDRINYGFTLTAFAIAVLLLFIGPQHRSENVVLNLFWAWWWPLILLGFPFVGRLWCAVCPFMIYGEVTQKLSLWLIPRQLKRWPREQAEKWGGWFLFGLFRPNFSVGRTLESRRYSLPFRLFAVVNYRRSDDFLGNF